MPIFATIFMILKLGSVGLPGLAGFVGEFLALMGAFEAGHAGLYGLNVAYAAAAGLGVVLSAAYLLYLSQQIFYGHVKDESNAALPDLTRREAALGWALAAITIGLGLQPSLITKPIERSIQATRLMVTAPEGNRPTWKDTDLEVTPSGELQRSGTTLAPADLHPTQVASRP
jgi:NADH-quinone oxidoreductase subunit M